MTPRYINLDAFVATSHVIAKEGTLYPTAAIQKKEAVQPPISMDCRASLGRLAMAGFGSF